MILVGDYSRISREEQREGYSLEAQRDDMRKFANSKGWEIVREYEDGGFSGGNDNRPAFKQMINDALAGEFNTILVHKLDRFSRNREDAIVYKSQLKKKGIRVVSVSEPLDDSPASMITEAILEAYNEYFLINLAHEIRKGKYKGAEKGEYQGGNVKFGYTLIEIDEKNKIVVNKKEADTVVTIHRKYAEGISQSPLAKWLNEQGIPCKNKGRWNKQKLSRILKDRTYIGEGKYGDVKMPYPPIVPTDLFDRVQARLATRPGGRPAKSGRTYLLSGLGRCGECGGALIHETQHKYRYIYCYNQSTYPDDYQCFCPKRLNVDWLEQEIWSAVEEVLIDFEKDTCDLMINKYKSSKADTEQQISKARAKIEQCKRERQTVLRQVRKDNITQADADFEFTAINKEQGDWENELNRLLIIDTNSKVLREKFLNQVHKVREQLRCWYFFPTPEEKKEMLNLLLDKFVLHRDGKIELRFKLPVNKEQVAEKIQELSCGALVT